MPGEEGGGNETLLAPEEHVLSTLERDGSRRWLRPRLSKGRFFRRRQIVAYALFGLYTALPFIRIHGRPAVLLDVPARQFTIFGFTFLPTDTLLLALALVGILLSFFMLTALVGRIWCGWACPQTVYMEFLFRPIERLFEGTAGRGGRPKRPPSSARLVGKYVVSFVLCLFVANTFLAYFVGVETLSRWVTRSPFAHPAPFLIVAAVTALMMFDFMYFREQMCILVCPYGRLQSVLLDRDSLIVAYDARRGEPRGKASLAREGKAGDCVDCGRCVTTCPTGIDIRDGLQMECINCTQCMDACDDVMRRLGRKPGLIRYSSQNRDAGVGRHLLRARTVIYPLLLAAVFSAFIVVFLGKQDVDAVLLRNPGQPYILVPHEGGDGVRNVFRVKLTNRTSERLPVELELQAPEGAQIVAGHSRVVLAPGEVQVAPLTIEAPATTFFGKGQAGLRIDVRREDGDAIGAVDGKMLGPLAPPKTAPHPQQENSP